MTTQFEVTGVDQGVADGDGRLAASMPTARSLLIVDNDKPASMRLVAHLTAYGFSVTWKPTVTEAKQAIDKDPPEFALLEMRIGRRNGLDVLEQLVEARPSTRVVILTQFDSLTTAALAIRMGAVDYLAKWPHVSLIAKSLLEDRVDHQFDLKPMSDRRIFWEYVQRIYELNDRNISETARKLDMHRRTLQRMLSKRSPK